MTQGTYNGKSVTPSNSLSDKYHIRWSFPMVADYPFIFFPMPAYVDWLYDIAFPARVDVTHRT